MIINIKIVVNIRLLDAKYLYSIQGVQFDFIRDSGVNILDYEWRCPSGIIWAWLKIYE